MTAAEKNADPATFDAAQVKRRLWIENWPLLLTATGGIFFSLRRRLRWP